MSQFYEGRAPRSLQRSNQPIEVPRTGITETLATPGLVFPETQVSRGQILFGQLERALGLGANLVGTAAQIDEAKDREIERLENKKEDLKKDIEREKRETDTILRGVQVQSARESLPGILSRIEAGDPQYLPPASRGGVRISNEDFAEELVGRFNAGESDVERSAFRNALIDNVIGALYKREETLRTKNHQTLLNTTLAGAAAADSEGLQNAVDVLVNRLDVPEPAARAAVAKSRLDYAVELASLDAAGARRAFDEAAAFAGDSLPEEVLNARNKIDNAIEADRRAKSNALADDLIRQLAEQPIEAVEAQLNRPLISSQLDGSDVYRLRQAIDAKRDAMRRETLSLIVNEQKAAYDEGFRNLGIALSQERGAGGGLYRLNDRKVTLANGQEYALKGSEVRQEIADRAWEETKRDPNPANAFGSMVEWVARNGVVPTEWDQTLNNAGLQASLAQIVPPRDGGKGYIQPAALPPSLLQAHEMYERIKSVSPGVAAKSMKDASTEALFDLASFAKTLPQTGGDPTRAMFAALRVAGENQKYGAAQVGFRAVEEVAEDIGGENLGYVQEEITRAAKFYMRLNGVTSEQALEGAAAAFEKNHTKINGHWVYTRNASLPTGLLEAMGPVVAKNYTNTLGIEEGLSPRDLTLVPVQDGMWALARTDIDDGSGVSLVENLASGTSIFTTAQLVGMLAEREQTSQQEALKRLEAEFNERGGKFQQRYQEVQDLLNPSALDRVVNY